jgi:hypothetical protein
VGARFGLDPGGLGRHGDALVGNLEKSLNFRLPHEENDLMLVDLLLVDDSRHVFELL